MDGGNICNCSYVKGRTRPYYDRRCKNKKMLLETNFDSLPDDVVLEILVRIPAQDIYISTTLVCRKWYKLINSPNFIDSHLQHTTLGLLVQNPDDRKSPLTFVATRNGRSEISKLSYEDSGLIQSSCNGLILLPGRTSYEDFYITNPVTKRRFALPQIFLEWQMRSDLIAYAPASMAYKVVHLFYDISSKSTCCSMLTVGVDKSWRRIVFSQHLSEMANGLVWCKPLTIEGFVLWARKRDALMLNVETEIFTLISMPECGGEKSDYSYLAGGSYLSVLIWCTKFSWDVWEMNPETGEWKKLPNIDLKARKRRFKQLCVKHYKSLNSIPTPIGWLKYQEVLVFKVYDMGRNVPSETGLCIAYNIRTQELESFELDSRLSRFFAHRNSLVSLNGC